MKCRNTVLSIDILFTNKGIFKFKKRKANVSLFLQMKPWYGHTIVRGAVNISKLSNS